MTARRNIVETKTQNVSEMETLFRMNDVEPLCGSDWLRRFYGKKYAEPRITITIRPTGRRKEGLI